MSTQIQTCILKVREDQSPGDRYEQIENKK